MFGDNESRPTFYVGRTGERTIRHATKTKQLRVLSQQGGYIWLLQLKILARMKHVSYSFRLSHTHNH